jgi:hypothetical protein
MKLIGSALILTVLLTSASAAQAAKTAYPKMAPVSQYLLPRDAEIALARSAAPQSISRNAEILVLAKDGFHEAVTGSNGFVCLVARSWSADYSDPGFWDPGLRAPICYNSLAAKSQVPATMERTRVALAGGSRAQILAAIKAGIASGELPAAEPGSMAYMMSRQAYLNYRVGPWRPHLMFFTPETDPKSWGAGLPASPILGIQNPAERSTVFLIPLSRWSDGTPSILRGELAAPAKEFDIVRLP